MKILFRCYYISQIMFIIKLGGSVITDKSKKYTYKKEIVDRLSSELKKVNKDLLLIHGAGSFGHILAKEYKLNQGFTDKKQLKGFSLTHAMVQKLNTMVLDSLHENDIDAVSIPPHVVLKLDDHKLLKIDYNIFKDCLDGGFTPVSFGDVALDEKLGFSICSGDLLVQLFAEHFKPEKVIFVIDEDGIYDSNPKINKNAELIDSASIDDLEKLTTSADLHADVTGGMGGKIETIKNISKHNVDTILVNGNKPDRLYKVLVGEKAICTIIYGGKK